MAEVKKLPRKFFEQPTLSVARKILGCELHFRNCAGIINEVEAYIGCADPACHAARGRTARNAVMWGKAGVAYVYFTYGMHFCLNFTTECEGFPAAILIRGVAATRGTAAMRRRRQRGPRLKKIPRKNGVTEKNLANGPSKLCEAFGIDLRQNGLDLCARNSEMFVTARQFEPDCKATPRVGIRAGQEKLWRFVSKNLQN
ncbi:DNA-3-methyladenine glycosylase [Patescibacteria group bacterium]|nr:DNA-3-methyladenine glycosylase [Patescibacteria group bacterium]